MRLLVSSPAENDAAEVIRYYADIRPALASDFLEELDATYSRLRRWPFFSESLRGSVRRSVMQHFRYHVIYRVERDAVHILALMPHAIDPADVTARLADFDQH